MSDTCEYTFDIVINKIVFHDPVNLDYLWLTLNFRNVDLDIRSSQPEGKDFREGRSLDFEAASEELKTYLEENPLKLQVKLGESHAGDIVMNWPDKLLTEISKDTFHTYSHFNEVDILRGEHSIGKATIAIKIDCKCRDRSGNLTCDKSGVNICDELDKLIDPNDVLFVIGDSKTENYGKNVLMQCGHDKCPASLDLSRYQVVRGQLIQTPEIVNTCSNLECCQLKNCDDDYDDVIKDLCKKSNTSQKSTPSKKKFKKTLCTLPRENRACQANKHVKECPHSEKFSEQSDDSSTSSEECPPPPKKHKRKSKKTSNSCFHGAPPYPCSDPNLVESRIVRPNLCPICCSDIAWLPKFAACPKCGYKPVPYKIEKKYDETLTADKILSDWLEHSDIPPNCQNKNTKKVNRCNCKNGKECASCRIQKIFSQIVAIPSKCEEESKICNPISCNAQKIENENKCLPRKKGGQDCLQYDEEDDKGDQRPHLTQVLSEIRFMYDISAKKEEIKKVKINEICEKKIVQEKQKFDKISKNKKSKGEQYKSSLSPKKYNGLKKNQKDTKKPKSKKYAYTTKAITPVLTRHSQCIYGGKSVPAKMGWLWNVDTVGIRRGWKPGAIRKPIKNIMKYFLKDYPIDNVPNTKCCRKLDTSGECQEDTELVQKPTLHVTKKHGEYLITMRPLKNAALLKECADPYLNVKPIQFKIIKDPLFVATSEIKRCLKTMFKKCCCHKPITCCICRTYLEKQRVEYELHKLCCSKGVPNLKDTLVLSDTTDTDSELDVEFTPPAGLVKPSLRKKPDVIYRETQYDPNDWNVPPVFPKKVNKYMLPFDCYKKYGIGMACAKKPKPPPPPPPPATTKAGKGAPKANLNAKSVAL